MIKLLEVKYRPEATSTLRNNKHTGIETSTTRRQFYWSLSKHLIHLLLNTRWWSCSHFHIKLLEITEQGRVWPKLKMVTWNHIQHKTVKSNASPPIQKWERSKKWESTPTWKTKDEDEEEAVECDTSEALTPTAPFILVLAELAEALLPADFLSPGWVSILLSKCSLLAKEAPLDSGTGLFCTLITEPRPWPGFATCLMGKGWDKPMGDCCWACVGDQFI